MFRLFDKYTNDRYINIGLVPKYLDFFVDLFDVIFFRFYYVWTRKMISNIYYW